MTGKHIGAVFIMVLELTVLFSIIVSCSLYTVIRILLGEKTTYPTVFASMRRADFILQHLGELEMFCTILSPAITGFYYSTLLNNYKSDS